MNTNPVNERMNLQGGSTMKHSSAAHHPGYILRGLKHCLEVMKYGQLGLTNCFSLDISGNTEVVSR